MTVVVNFVAAVLVARRERLDRTQTTNLATTILARGEFSLIIAALGAEAGLDARVVPFVAGYVLVLALGAHRSSPRSRHGSPAACPSDSSARRVSRSAGRCAAAASAAWRRSW